MVSFYQLKIEYNNLLAPYSHRYLFFYFLVLKFFRGHKSFYDSVVDKSKTLAYSWLFLP